MREAVFIARLFSGVSLEFSFGEASLDGRVLGNAVAKSMAMKKAATTNGTHWTLQAGGTMGRIHTPSAHVATNISAKAETVANHSIRR